MAPESNNQARIIERESQVFMHTYRRLAVVAERGEGCFIFDESGKKYLDLFAGIGVDSVGHSHPRWIDALATQSRKLVHVSNLLYSEPMVELAERLVSLSGLDRVFFCNSGTEAVEAAIKIARKLGKARRGNGCYKLITFERAFHGRTYGSLSATGKYGDPFVPLVPGFCQLPSGNLALVEEALDDSVCAVMIEPVQGEGGVWPVEPEFLKTLRHLCNERGVLLILDEVQTGIGRTGMWFGFQRAGILPDIATAAKGLGGGFPIGACLARGDAATTLAPGDHGSTFAGSPLAAAAALAVLRIIEEERLLENVRSAGARFEAGLRHLSDRYSETVEAMRGLGLMLALDLKRPIAGEIIRLGIAQGVLLNKTSDHSLRFLPPLIISLDEVQLALRVLEEIFTSLPSD